MDWFQRVLWSVAAFLLSLAFALVFLDMLQRRPWLAGTPSFREMKEWLLIEAAVVAVFSLLGWLVWLLPVALWFAPDETKWSTRRLILRGGALGGLLTTVICVILFHGEPHAIRFTSPFIVAGLLEGVCATALCTWGIRGAARRARQR